MLAFLPFWFRGALSLMLLMLNTAVCGSAVIFLVPFKWIIHIRRWRKFWTGIMISIASLYILNNKFIYDLFNHTDWDISGIENLYSDRQYLVVANHQSTMDIPVLQWIFYGYIPFPRFFIKQELLWVPFLGLALWALDMPVMRRYSRKKLKGRPDLRTKDLQRTNNACQLFRDQPLTLLNFAEGTRYSWAKHEAENSPFQLLLNPKSGGVHTVLTELGDQIDAILDVTIIYPGLMSPTIGDMAFGRIPKIQVRVDRLEIGINGVPSLEEIQGRKGKQVIRDWLKQRWKLKDILLCEIQQSILSEFVLRDNTHAPNYISQ